MKNTLIDPVTLAFDFSAPKPYHFYDIPRSFSIPSLNSLGSFVFEVYCGQTNRQTDRQADELESPTYADRQSQRR